VRLLAHLTEADIQRYVAGVPSTETDRHVRVCLNGAQGQRGWLGRCHGFIVGGPAAGDEDVAGGSHRAAVRAYGQTRRMVYERLSGRTRS
jgi:hypothetical protein